MFSVNYWGMRPSIARALLAKGNRDGDVCNHGADFDTEADARAHYEGIDGGYSDEWVELARGETTLAERPNPTYDAARCERAEAEYWDLVRQERRVLYGE